ncbi:uncharacterized protein LOC122360714 [Puntigrus tetrazona]|uniref:uncharacterized protein LOC122360714 n=1 Tax=Puntigrus tetrazona TaxID=1606681 RepID=UPI001C89DB23|nr:uncharacterized protein LOC122360714 [Puntigrus tetrazona]
MYDGRWTGEHGTNISVHDLRVSMSRSRVNGGTIVGDSVNLTCTLNCSDHLSEVRWFKNGDLIQHSEPVLTFTRITAKDSGNYSCSLRNFRNAVSEEFTIYIEADVAGSPSVLIIVASLVSLVFITAAAMLIRRRKAKTQRKPTEEREEAQDCLYSIPQKAACRNQPEAKDVQQKDEVEYASVSIKPKEQLQMPANTEQGDDSTIYSAVING